MAQLFANSGDPDQTPLVAASDLGLQCLLVTLLGVSRQQWVKQRLFAHDIEPFMCVVRHVYTKEQNHCHKVQHINKVHYYFNLQYLCE